ncbi:hypothetical protein ABZV68_23950, partial [Streptomyces clavifer]|uniref:hypothetical protein n=1 Tax=Streptomyces clavifer TaxID=68188 RepID=UPI0033A3248B
MRGAVVEAAQRPVVHRIGDTDGHAKAVTSATPGFGCGSPLRRIAVEPTAILTEAGRQAASPR